MATGLEVKVLLEPLLEGIEREQQLHQHDCGQPDWRDVLSREGVWDGSC
jgi:hypothetical protein